MANLQNFETQLAAKIAALTGAETLVYMRQLQMAAEGTDVDTSSLDAHVQTKLDALDANSTGIDLAAGNLLAVNKPKAGSPLPSIDIPHLYGEAATKGERGYVGHNIFTKEQVFIPRKNRGLLKQISTEQAYFTGGHSGGTTNVGAPNHCKVIARADGKILTIGYLADNQYTSGSASASLYAKLYDTKEAGHTLLDARTIGSTVCATAQPYGYGTIDAFEAKEDFYVGYVQTPYTTSSIRFSTFHLNVDPVANIIQTYALLISLTSLTMGKASYERRFNFNMCVSNDGNKVWIAKPMSELFSNSVQVRLSHADITGTPNNYTLGTFTQVAGSNYYQAVSNNHASAAVINDGFHQLSDGNIISMRSGGNPSTPPDYYSNEGDIAVISTTDNSVLTMADFSDGGDYTNSNANTEDYYKYEAIAFMRLSTDSFLVLTGSISYGDFYGVLKVDYNPTGNVLTVTEVGRIPENDIQGCYYTVGVEGIAWNGAAGLGTKAAHWDLANKRLTLVGTLCVNIVEFNADWSVKETRKYRTLITDVINQSTRNPIISFREQIRCSLSPDGNFLYVVDSNEQHSNNRDGYKLHYLYSVDIRQAGAIGYPVTVREDSAAGNDVKSYGLSDGYVSLINGVPFSKLEDVYVLTDTVALIGDVPEDGLKNTVRDLVYYTSTTTRMDGASDLVDGYTSSDFVQTAYVPRFQYNVNLDTEANLVVEADNYDVFGVMQYQENNANTVMTSMIVVDGFLVARSDGSLTAASTDSSHYYYGISLNRPEEFKMWAGIDVPTGQQISYMER